MRVGILGATGAVGLELIQILESRNFPVESLRLLASERSAGTQLGPHTVVCATPESCSGLDLLFCSAGAQRSRDFAPVAIASGATVIDNSSAFRMDSDVPLIIPEINMGALRPEHKLVANPNCTAIILLMAIKPLLGLGTVERVIVSTYQSVSGAGAAAVQELMAQTRAILDGEVVTPNVLPHQTAFNVFSHNTEIGADGYSEEESKVINESRKILGMPDLKINVTCIRVPVIRAHTESITVEFAGRAPSEEAVREALMRAPGVTVVDDRVRNLFPMPIDAGGIDDVLVGRIRQDLSNPNAICLMASGDQLRKGAALNAVQIAEILVANGTLVPGVMTHRA